MVQQIASGLRIVAALALGLLVLGVLIHGELTIMGIGPVGAAPVSAIIGYCELLFVAAVLWFTVPRWSRWVAGVAFLGTVKAAFSLIEGKMPTPPFKEVSRIEAAEVMCCLIVVCWLSIRFASRPPAALEKLALLILVFGICANMLWDSARIAVMVGVAALLIAHFVSPRIQIWKRDRDRASHPQSAG